MVSVTPKSGVAGVNGNANDVTPLESYFVQLFNNDGTLATAVTTIETNGSSVFKLALGGVPGSPAIGQIWYDAANALLKIQEATGTQVIFTSNYIPISRGLRNTAAPVYASTTTFTVASIMDRDQNQGGDILKAGSTTVDITTTGQNGIGTSANLTGTVTVNSGTTGVTFSTSQTLLQTGDTITTAGGQVRRLISGSGTSWTADANWSSTETTVTVKRGGRRINTWYYLYSYAQSDQSTPGLILDTRNAAAGEAIRDTVSVFTGTASTVLYRQQAFALRLNATGSGEIIPFKVGDGWPFRPRIRYNVALSAWIGGFGAITAGTPQVLAAGTATSYTAIDCSSFAPKVSTELLIQTIAGAGTSGFTLRATGQTHTGSFCGTGTGGSVHQQFLLDCNSSQSIDYKRETGTGSLCVDVVGFTVTEIN